MNKELKNSGLVISPIVDERAYVLGAGMVPQIVLEPTGDWSDVLPTTEQQNINFETYGCTAFGTTNAIEMLIFKLFGEKVNYSDRWVGIISGTKAPGNDPHVVAEAIRKNGLIPEEMLPFKNINNIDEYYSFKGADEVACRKAGKDWLAKYTFKHEWCFDKNQPFDEKVNNMKTALRYSPLCLGVYAWSQENGVYVSQGSENHWTTKIAQPNFSIIFDSYDPYIKTVNQNFSYCKRFHIERNTIQEQISLIQRILNLMYSLMGLLKAQTPTPPPIAPPVPIPAQPTPIPSPPTPPKYLWGTKEEARHSVRVICDEEGLDVSNKNIFCAVMGAESGWNPKAIGKPNSDGTRDYGICQINTYYWIGQGKPFPSTDYVLNNPEVCVRWACKQWKAGHRSYWWAYTNGSFTKFL